MSRLQDDRCRVLVVDDNRDNADSIAMLLKMAGRYEIETAYDGEQALSAFQAFDPSVAVLDLAMPKVSGYDLARNFKERKPDVRLIAVSGLAYPADIVRSKEAGFDHHLVKPIDVESLQKLLPRDPLS